MGAAASGIAAPMLFELRAGHRGNRGIDIFVVERQWLGRREVIASAQLAIVVDLERVAPDIDVDAHANQVLRQRPVGAIAHGNRAVGPNQTWLAPLPAEVVAGL